MRQKTGPRVAVVAIAKDEAAYLPEWIHHCLYFGFEKVFIGINRTTDSTYRILDNIQEKFPQVIDHNLDWVDQGVKAEKNLHMQGLAYAFLSHEIKKNHEDITHVFYCDVDEFWFSRGFEHNIGDYLERLPEFDIVSFNWLNQTGDTTAFEPPFKNSGYVPDLLIKSIVPVRNFDKITLHHPHAPTFIHDVTHIDANGNRLGYRVQDFNNGFSHFPPEDTEAFVLHRMIRSEKEYLALLLRENPGTHSPVKPNRDGFYTHVKSALHLPAETLENYWSSLDLFLERCNLSTLLKQAGDSVLDRSKNVLDVKPQTLMKFLETYLKALEGTAVYGELLVRLEAIEHPDIPESTAINLFFTAKRMEAKHKKIEALQLMKLAGKSQNGNVEASVKRATFDTFREKIRENPQYQEADLSREIALFSEKHAQPEAAALFFEIARNLRPQGSFIVRKSDEYRALLNRVIPINDSSDALKQNIKNMIDVLFEIENSAQTRFYDALALQCKHYGLYHPAEYFSDR